MSGGGGRHFGVTRNNKFTLISIDMTESSTKRVRLVTQIILIDDKINVDLSRTIMSLAFCSISVWLFALHKIEFPRC